MNLAQRFAQWLADYTNLAAVTAVPVGQQSDGLVHRPAGSPLDKSWGDLYLELTDSRTAWQKNPLARRIVGLITSYTVGTGIRLQSDYTQLDRFLDSFWQHNNLDIRLHEWCDELSRAGELYPVLFHNRISGMSTVRTVPACLIETVEYDDNDYEKELRYRETQPIGAPEKWWLSPHNDDADAENGVMLHYAVNRPTGAVRGESDLAPILPWLRRYNRWLEDRVRLNAAVRSFLWIVHAPARLRTELEERYRKPPDPGSVIIAEEGAETWEAVTPNLNASDAEKDGRAIRWMIVAGGPGTALLDIGEGEDSNLATGKAMAEQRRRFLRRRQAYLIHLLTDLAWEAWLLTQPAKTTRSTRIDRTAITALAPDISPEDNTDLATAAQSLAGALQQMEQLTGSGETFRTISLRMFAKFAGETISEDEINSILQEGTADRELRRNTDQHDAGSDEKQRTSELSSRLDAITPADFTEATRRGNTNGTGV